MSAVGLTDHGSMAGAIELYRETQKHGIKPLLGSEVYIADDRRAQTKGWVVGGGRLASGGGMDPSLVA
jgi:DNA polymerase-3 subunit alpha